MAAGVTMRLEIFRSKEARRRGRQFEDEHRGRDRPQATGIPAHKLVQRSQGRRRRVPRGLVGGKADRFGQGPPPSRKQEQGTEPDEVEAAPAQG
jgi:hypothetical protein